MAIAIKRAYDQPGSDDRLRVLGDFDPFAERYRSELDAGDAGGVLVAVVAAHDRTTLVTAVREIEPSHASVLRDWITARATIGGPP